MACDICSVPFQSWCSQARLTLGGTAVSLHNLQLLQSCDALAEQTPLIAITANQLNGMHLRAPAGSLTWWSRTSSHSRSRTGPMPTMCPWSSTMPWHLGMSEAMVTPGPYLTLSWHLQWRSTKM
jgi:hypothetical protein